MGTGGLRPCRSPTSAGNCPVRVGRGDEERRSACAEFNRSQCGQGAFLMSDKTFTRREALGGLSGLVAGAPFVPGQPVRAQRPPTLAPVDELVNPLEFEEMAKLKLDDAPYSKIAGSDRSPFDRMTFRAR